MSHMDNAPSKAAFAIAFQAEFARKKALFESATGKPYGFRTAAKHLATKNPTAAVIPHGSPPELVAALEKAHATRLVESWRKQLQRYWWARTMPSEATRVLIAEELGCSAALFGVEEGDADDPLSRSLERDLLARIQGMQRAKRREVRELQEMERRLVSRGAA